MCLWKSRKKPCCACVAPIKNIGSLKKWFKHAGKAIEPFPAILGIIVDAILNFLSKAGFVAEYT